MVKSPGSFPIEIDQAGVDGGIVFPRVPPDFRVLIFQSKNRNVLEWTKGHKWLFPFYFIDPTGETAMDEVDLAASMGIKVSRLFAVPITLAILALCLYTSI